MKDVLDFQVDKNLESQNKIEINIKKQQEIEYVLEGTIVPKNGQKIFELNEETGDISEAKYKRDTATLFNGQDKVSEKLIIKSGCVYIPALNAENVRKKYDNNKEQSFYFKKKPIFKISDITFKL